MDEAQLNSEVKKWVTDVEQSLKGEAKQLGIIHRSNSPSKSSSIEQIKGKTTSRFRIVNKISFVFPRHMVFVHKGLGRDTPVAKAGTTNRKAKEWFEPVTDKKIETLADIVAENMGDTITAQLHF